MVCFLSIMIRLNNILWYVLYWERKHEIPKNYHLDLNWNKNNNPPTGLPTHTHWACDTRNLACSHVTHQAPYFTCNFTISHSQTHFSHTNQLQFDCNKCSFFLLTRRMSEVYIFPTKSTDFQEKNLFTVIFFFILLYFL